MRECPLTRRRAWLAESHLPLRVLSVRRTIIPVKTALALLVSTCLIAQSLTLQIRVPAEAPVARIAGRARTLGVTVQVADQSGKPVSGAVVTFRMPDEGPSGSFGDGLSSAIVVTGPDGRATTSPVRWGPLSGVCEIRVAAAGKV